MNYNSTRIIKVTWEFSKVSNDRLHLRVNLGTEVVVNMNQTESKSK